MNPFALRAIFYFSLAVSAFWFAGSPAWAQFYVRSPEVEKGVAEVEEHGAVYADPGPTRKIMRSRKKTRLRAASCHSPYEKGAGAEADAITPECKQLIWLIRTKGRLIGAVSERVAR